ncbi:unnamed protein product, partial [Closterium sp. NIES-54]
ASALRALPCHEFCQRSFVLGYGKHEGLGREQPLQHPHSMTPYSVFHILASLLSRRPFSLLPLPSSYPAPAGASALRALPSHEFCQRSFVLGYGKHEGLGNNLYKILTAPALALMLNRSIIVGENYGTRPLMESNKTVGQRLWKDYLAFSPEVFSMLELRHLWYQHDCERRYRRPLVVRTDSFANRARSRTMCDDWSTWQEPIICFDDALDSVGIQTFLKNLHPSMRESAHAIMGLPWDPNSRPNLFGEIARVLLLPTPAVADAVKWALGSGGKDADVVIHFRHGGLESVASAAALCLRKALEHIHRVKQQDEQQKEQADALKRIQAVAATAPLTAAEAKEAALSALPAPTGALRASVETATAGAVLAGPAGPAGPAGGEGGAVMRATGVGPGSMGSRLLAWGKGRIRWGRGRRLLETEGKGEGGGEEEVGGEGEEVGRERGGGGEGMGGEEEEGQLERATVRRDSLVMQKQKGGGGKGKGKTTKGKTKKEKTKVGKTKTGKTKKGKPGTAKLGKAKKGKKVKWTQGQKKAAGDEDEKGGNKEGGSENKTAGSKNAASDKDKLRVVVVADHPSVFRKIGALTSDFAKIIRFDHAKFVRRHPESPLASAKNKSLPSFRVRDWGPLPRWVALVDFFLAARARYAFISAGRSRVFTTFSQLAASLAAARSLEDTPSPTASRFLLLSAFHSHLLENGLANQGGRGHAWHTFSGRLSCLAQPPQCALSPALPYAWWDAPWQSPARGEGGKLRRLGLQVGEGGEVGEEAVERFCERRKGQAVRVKLDMGLKEGGEEEKKGKGMKGKGEKEGERREIGENGEKGEGDAYGHAASGGGTHSGGGSIGAEDWEVARLREWLRQLQTPLPWLPLLDHPQMASHLLAIAVSARPMYLAWTMPPRPEVVDAFSDWDSNLEECFEQLSSSGTWNFEPARSMLARLQLHLPVRLGGFGIRAATSLSPLSYACGQAEAARDILQLGVAGEEAMFADYLRTVAGVDFLDPWFSKSLEQLPEAVCREMPSLPIRVAALPPRSSLPGAAAAVGSHADFTLTAAEWSIAAAVRLGLPIQQLHVAGHCVCGTVYADLVDPHHALRCKY